MRTSSYPSLRFNEALPNATHKLCRYSESTNFKNWCAAFFQKPIAPELEVKVRAELSDYNHQYKESAFGSDLKHHWRSDYPRMSKLTRRRPPTSPLSFTIMKFCNKSTISYIAPSAQKEGRCSDLNFPCMYKAWYRCHGNKPDKNFACFCATPIQITANGPKPLRRY